MTESDHRNIVCREQKSYAVFRTRLDEAVCSVDSPDKLLQLEDILYDILEQEFQINDMLNEHFLGGGRK